MQKTSGVSHPGCLQFYSYTCSQLLAPKSLPQVLSWLTGVRLHRCLLSEEPKTERSYEERMYITIPKNEFTPSLRRPQLTPSTICPPRLNVGSPPATKEWARPQAARATTLLNKVVSQPASPRSKTPATSNAQGTGSSDYFSSQSSSLVSNSKGLSLAARVDAQAQPRAKCENSR